MLGKINAKEKRHLVKAQRITSSLPKVKIHQNGEAKHMVLTYRRSETLSTRAKTMATERSLKDQSVRLICHAVKQTLIHKLEVAK